MYKTQNLTIYNSNHESGVYSLRNDCPMLKVTKSQKPKPANNNKDAKDSTRK